MFNLIQGGGGILTRSSYELEDQLYPENVQSKDIRDEYTRQDIHSKSLGKTVGVWSKAVVDVERLANNVSINNEIIEYAFEDINKVEKMFDRIVASVGGDECAAQSVCNLMNQGLLTSLKNATMEAKKHTKTENGLTEFAFHATNDDKKIVLETGKNGTFKLIEEQLLALRDARDPSIISKYYKAKVIVTGKISDLAERDVKRLEYKMMYTGDYTKREAAKKGSYPMTGFSFKDTETYLAK